MGILDNLRAVGNALLGKRQNGVAYANTYPAFEYSSPQYPQPNPYNLAQLGYRRDELVYACVNYRANTISEPPAKLYTGKGDDKDEVGGLFETFPNGRPNSEMSEMEFWQVSEMYRNIAGNAIWEIETNRLGQPISLWPLNPAYCSFMRGEQRPLAQVRYQYPGMPQQDIPRERLVIFQNFDPLYPMLKGLSPTAIALRSIGVHTSTTDFLDVFFKRGANIQGYLKFAQSLNDAEAARARKMWRDNHGGSTNWGENNIGVLGQGAEYVPTQMNFRDMAFEAIDGRTEAAICQVFNLSPILLGAKVGLNASTYSNYEQAMENYVNIVLKPSWRWYSGEITQQLLPYLDQEGAYCEFDVSDVSAMQEDEDALWARVMDAAVKNIITRDEAREKIGYDPVDDAPVFVGVTLKGPEAPPLTARIADPEFTEADIPEPPPTLVRPSPFATTTTGGAEFSPPTVTDETQLKTWRANALTHLGEPAGTPFDAELAQCKSKSQVRAVFEAHWPTRKLDPVLELQRYNDLAERNIKGGQGSGNFGHTGRPGLVGGSGGGGSGGSSRGKGSGSSRGKGKRYSPKVKGEVKKLYRATNDASDAETVPLGSHWSDDPAVAQAYTDNPGFGGSQVISANIDTGNIADWTDDAGGTRTMIRDLMGDDDEAQQMQSDWSGYQPFQALENAPKLSELAAEKYDFIKFTDDFPEGATTFKRTR